MALKILICEDERISHVWLSRNVKSWGHQVVSAYDGSNSIRLAGEEKPDIILLDMLFPDMDGVEVLKAIRAEAETENIPVIVISATPAAELEPKLQPYDVAAILKKPPKPDDLKQLFDDMEQQDATGEQNAPIFIVIDPSGVHRRVMEHFLEELGCQALAVGTSEEAIGLLRNVQAIGSILDLSCENECVGKLMKNLRTSADTSLPVIALATGLDQSTVSELFHHGVSDILLKPLSFDRVKASIIRILDRGTDSESKESADAGSVLVVEDFSITANLLKKIVSESGFRVTVVQSGQIAIDIIKRQTPTLMLMDLNMPGMDGIELVHQLIEMTIPVPFAVITGEKDEARVKKIRSLGALKVFKKPVKPEDLRSFVSGFHTASSSVCKPCTYQVLFALADEKAADVIESTLIEADLIYRIATDGYQAIAEARGRPPVAVVDLSLTGLGGLNTIKEIRKIAGSDRIRILALAEHLDQETSRKLSELGVDDSLEKPFDLNDLVSRIRLLLNSSEQLVEMSEFTSQFIGELDQVPAPGDQSYFEQVKRIGHNLAGTAELVGLDTLCSAGTTLEQAAAAGDGAACGEQLEQIRAVLEKSAVAVA